MNQTIRKEIRVAINDAYVYYRDTGFSSGIFLSHPEGLKPKDYFVNWSPINPMLDVNRLTGDTLLVEWTKEMSPAKAEASILNKLASMEAGN